MSADASANRLAIDGGTPVRTEPLPWELPGAHWIGAEELQLVSRVVEAGSPFRYYGLDPQHMVDRLEEGYRRRLGRAYALAVGSGTAGLHVALGALGIGPGDEVLLPGYMWVSCISAVVRLGAIPRLVDIDETFCMDPADLRGKIGPRSKAVLLAHMSGAPGRVDEILQVARTAGIPVVEDVAQANGARLHGRHAGSCDLNCRSRSSACSGVRLSRSACRAAESAAADSSSPSARCACSLGSSALTRPMTLWPKLRS